MKINRKIILVIFVVATVMAASVYAFEFVTNIPIRVTPNDASKSQPSSIYYVKNFGAVGDGVTDDSRAVQRAISAAISEGMPNPVIEFAPGGIYAFKSKTLEIKPGFLAALNISGAAGLTLNGNGAKIEIYASEKLPLRGFVLSDSTDVVMRGLTFAYKPSPFVSVTVDSVDMNSSSITVFSREALLPNSEVWRPSSAYSRSYFGLQQTNERLQLFIREIASIGDNRYRISANTERTQYLESVLKRLPGGQFLLPNPSNGHLFISAFNIFGSAKVRLENIEIESAPLFVFNVRDNTGPLTFYSVNIRPPVGSDVPMVAWRDGFHCKDNRGPLTWINCFASGLHDDIINIATTTRLITSVEVDRDGHQRLRLKATEPTSSHPMAGDIISIIDPQSGADYDKVVLASVLSPEEVVLSKEIKGLKTGLLVSIESLAAPGSKISNCHWTGTFRFKGRVLVENTTFDMLKIWLDNEIVRRPATDGSISHSLFVEGPIPCDQVYRNCVFNGVIPDAAIIVNTYKSETGAPEYNVRNIRFESCKFNGVALRIAGGNDVVFD